MADPEPVYNASARQRIDATVIDRENGAFLSSLSRLSSTHDRSHSFRLARANEFRTAPSVASFTFLESIGTKGSEADSTYVDVNAYVRRGLVFENAIYILIDICPGTTTIFDVLNPTLHFHGITDASIGYGATGTVSVYHGSGPGTDTGENIATVYNGTEWIDEAMHVECFWHDTTSANEWRIVESERYQFGHAVVTTDITGDGPGQIEISELDAIDFWVGTGKIVAAYPGFSLGSYVIAAGTEVWWHVRKGLYFVTLEKC